MHKTNFSQNPNHKLCWDRFGDCRLNDPGKYFPGNDIEILLRDKPIGVAHVLAATEFKFSQLRDSFAFLNCGKHAAYQATLLNKYYNGGVIMSADTKLQHIVFEWKVRDMACHKELFELWWSSLADEYSFDQTLKPIA